MQIKKFPGSEKLKWKVFSYKSVLPEDLNTLSKSLQPTYKRILMRFYVIYSSLFDFDGQRPYLSSLIFTKLESQA